jgi:RimJ/RimL family protein N-acetyltransferase
MLDHVFGPLGLNKLWCEVLAGNEAVWKLHLSFGFVEEARFRQHVFKGGAFLDVLGLGLLADDWRRARPACVARLAAKGFGAVAVP